jgi:hypothetical protein
VSGQNKRIKVSKEATESVASQNTNSRIILIIIVLLGCWRKKKAYQFLYVKSTYQRMGLKIVLLSTAHFEKDGDDDGVEQERGVHDFTLCIQCSGVTLHFIDL